MERRLIVCSAMYYTALARTGRGNPSSANGRGRSRVHGHTVIRGQTLAMGNRRDSRTGNPLAFSILYVDMSGVTAFKAP